METSAHLNDSRKHNLLILSVRRRWRVIIRITIIAASKGLRASILDWKRSKNLSRESPILTVINSLCGIINRWSSSIRSPNQMKIMDTYTITNHRKIRKLICIILIITIPTQVKVVRITAIYIIWATRKLMCTLAKRVCQLCRAEIIIIRKNPISRKSRSTRQ